MKINIKNYTIMKKLLFLAALLSAMVLNAAPVTGSSTEHIDGNPFTKGYSYSFDADKGEVTISFTALDTYEGLVAYLWNYTSGFAEKQMTVTGQTATITLHNQPSGANLEFACKFAYAGGMSVTKRFQYTVPAYEGGQEQGGEQKIYWSDWMGDGAGGGIYTEKYKVQDINGINPINIQHPGFATADGIYITFPAAVSSVSVSADLDGAGICLHLSALTAEYTTVTVVCVDGQSYTFMVYFVDGTKAAGLTQRAAAVKAKKVMENGQVVIISNGARLNIFGQPINQ